MTDKYTEVLQRLTASDQVFAFQEELNKSGITYTESLSTLLKLSPAFFEFGLLFPEWEFIVFNDERYTYQDIHKRAAQTANALKDAGVKRVIVLLSAWQIILSILSLLWL